jgi:hypothetical protein
LSVNAQPVLSVNIWMTKKLVGLPAVAVAGGVAVVLDLAGPWCNERRPMRTAAATATRVTTAIACAAHDDRGNVTG